MFDIEKSLDKQILDYGKGRPTVIFTEVLDPRQLEAVCYLTRFLRPVLLSSEKEIRKVIKEELDTLDPHRIEFTLSEAVFIEPEKESALLDEFAAEYISARAEDGKNVSMHEARRMVAEPCMFGIFAVRLGLADIVVGGTLHEPVTYFRPLIRFLKKREVTCETGVFILPEEHSENTHPHNLVVFGDVGVNGTMTPEILANVAVDTCTIARNLIPEEVLPKIHGAIVSYSNHGSDEGSSPELVKKATELVPPLLEESCKQDPRYNSIFIEGEVKANVALSERSAMYYGKGNKGKWTGAANAIICPNLDMGNLLYHLYATRFPSAKKFTVLSGVDFRGVDLAKDCSAEDIRLGVKAPILSQLKKGYWRVTPRDTFFRRYRILAINPGSTSTKISVYEGDNELFTEELQHSTEELAPYEGKSITSQFAFRKEAIVDFLSEHKLTPDDLDAVSARGGLVKPIAHGTYKINNQMLEDIEAKIGGEHASNLGALIADELVKENGRPAFITDPIVVDEVAERARITGVKELRRYTVSHALNQIASARRYAEENESFYENLNIIVAHMGGGISVGAHKKGCYIDVNNALNGEGPFSPQRSGSLPVAQLINLCFSGKYSQDEILKLNKGRGGLIDLLGTNDLREVEKMAAQGNQEAIDVFEAQAYQVAKEITSLLPAFDGESVDQIILTGGMARSENLVKKIKEYVFSVGCGVTVYAGENEMIALAKGALRVLQGKEEAREYNPQ
ncbi:MAG: butyrate kinase [Spirochaetales bacterium]|nr:butyrate kinase [Spirochaetales bacterium]